MKVRVIKASKRAYWYADNIGYIFDVILNRTGTGYCLTQNNDTSKIAGCSGFAHGNAIDVNDAIVAADVDDVYSKTRFDLEEQLMQCWSIINQIDTVTEGVIEYDWTPDQISNALIGIKEVYNLKFEKIFMLQETLIRTGKLK